MKLKTWVQIIAVGLSVVTLTACSSAHKKNAWSMNDSNNQAMNDDAQSSGLGEEDRLGDGTSGKRLATNKNTYYFAFDSDAIHPDDRASIAAHADKLANSGHAKVMLEGHTDPRGSREYNIGLGERRAKSVAEAMASKGVKANQLRLVSYGAEKPATHEATESAYQKDRRVVLVEQSS